MRRAVALAVFALLGATRAFATEPPPNFVMAPPEPAPAVVAAVPDPLVPPPAPEPSTLGRAPELDLRQDAPEPPTAPPPAEDLGLGWTLIRTMVVLGIVIMAIYITLNFGLRRLMGVAAVPRGQAMVQVLERIPLDQKRAMFVVKAGGEYLLIGGADGALQLISKLDAKEVEKSQAQRPPPPLALSPFLQKLLKRRDEVPAPPAPGDPT